MLLSVQDDAGIRTFQVTRALTSVGSGARCHLRLSGEGIAEVHALLYRDEEGYHISAGDSGAAFQLNEAPARGPRSLAEGDEIALGSARIVILAPQAPSSRGSSGEQGAFVATTLVEHLERFSRSVLAEEPWPAPAEALLDSMLKATGGEHGFLVLLERDDWRVVAARPLMSDDFQREVVSSHIVRQVLETATPVVLGDAAGDPAYAGAPSVARLKLRSVICLPLRRGSSVLGALYVGSSAAAGLFADSTELMAQVFCAQATLLLENARYVEQLRHRVSDLRERLASVAEQDLIASSPVMQRVVERCARAAPTDVTVLLQGETGTGKEVLARLVHDASTRSQGGFVAINCAALPPHLLESELFGHVRGSFTGADRDRVGLVETASGGTLFLDEIGELSLDLQPKLLRVLQERSLRRVGEQRSRSVDIRVIAASNRELKTDPAFRPDLYYRLAQIVVDVPPLRDRGEDLFLLAHYLLRRFCAEFQREYLDLTPAAEQAMERHHWPGNVRELENRLRQAALLTRGTHIGPEDLQLSSGPQAERETLNVARDRFIARYVQRALRRAGNHHPTAAAELGISIRSLYRYLKLDPGE